MDFYNLEYIAAHQSLDAHMRMVAIIVILVLALGFSVFYLRNRIRTRWRDVGIGLLVLSLVLLGVQVDRYAMVAKRTSQSQRLIDFIQGVSEDQNVAVDKVYVNSTTLVDGMIVRLDDRDEEYILHLNDDDNSYTLERAHIIDHNVYLNGEE